MKSNDPKGGFLYNSLSCYVFQRSNFSLHPAQKIYSKLFALIFFSLPSILSAQTTVFKETIGTYSGTISVTSYTGWSNGTTYIHSVPTGNVNLNNSVRASDYTTASGGTPVKVSANSSWVISGINTASYSNIQLSFGIHKVNFRNTGSDMHIEVSSDGVNYTTLNWPLLPSVSGTGDTWYYKAGGTDVTGSIPSTTNLRIRFRNAGSDTYDFDDIELKGAVVVPIYFLGFEVSKTTTGSNLIWHAANEQNVDLFELQKSIDGTHYVTFARVPARNSGSVEVYSYQDNTINNTRTYYRIKANEHSGAVKISGTVLMLNSDERKAFTAYANETRTAITLFAPKDLHGCYSYEIFSLKGEMLRKGPVIIDRSKTTIELQNGLPSGVYIIRLSNSNYHKAILTRF